MGELGAEDQFHDAGHEKGQSEDQIQYVEITADCTGDDHTKTKPPDGGLDASQDQYSDRIEPLSRIQDGFGDVGTHGEKAENQQDGADGTEMTGQYCRLQSVINCKGLTTRSRRYLSLSFHKTFRCR